MPPGTPDNPLRVAVIGSGPAGFYSAGHLLNAKEVTAEVDLYDRLPTPFGLVRAGVAPDHPKIKSVTRVYDKAAAQDGFRFFGNVEVGKHISHDDLAARYHAVIYSYGDEDDRHMGIPGEELPGSWAATDFVGWYNGHPDYRDLEFDLSCERAVVVGNGNVAMDVARMLVLPRAELEITDTADYAIEAIANSNIREVVILGRRGPAQAAFTNPELRELGELTDADVIVEPFELDRHSTQSISHEGELTPRRNVEILTDFAGREPAGKSKRVELRFLVSPVELQGDGKVEAVKLVRNELEHGGDGKLRAEPTSDHEVLEAGIVFRSIGYRGRAIEGVPFDEWHGRIPNAAGRVLDSERETPIPGLYTAGWIKRGPSGVIGTNKRDAQETVDHLLDDLAEGRIPEPAEATRKSVDALIAEQAPDHVTWQGWQSIDAAETAAGEPQGRPRVKLTSIDEMLAAALQRG
jgi:ferredoxin--NADP+ reductase